jgi:hypothetical protein
VSGQRMSSHQVGELMADHPAMDFGVGSECRRRTGCGCDLIPDGRVTPPSICHVVVKAHCSCMSPVLFGHDSSATSCVYVVFYVL